MSESIISAIWLLSFVMIAVFEIFFPYRIHLFLSIAASCYISFIVSLFDIKKIYSCITFLFLSLLIYFVWFFISMYAERKKSLICIALCDIPQFSTGSVLCSDNKIRYVENNNFITIKKGMSTNLKNLVIQEKQNEG